MQSSQAHTTTRGNDLKPAEKPGHQQALGPSRRASLDQHTLDKAAGEASRASPIPLRRRSSTAVGSSPQPTQNDPPPVPAKRGPVRAQSVQKAALKTVVKHEIKIEPRLGGKESAGVVEGRLEAVAKSEQREHRVYCKVRTSVEGVKEEMCIIAENP